MAQVGFGTGNLYGGKERASSVALVRAALDAGIRWIDTAPLYGHGAAEAIVGEAIRGRRDDLTLVSKAGVLPSRLTFAYKVHARIAGLAGKLPGGRKVLPSPAPRRPRFNVFMPSEVRASVERSLRALGTDRLDFLLLHEADPADAADIGLRDVLRTLVAEGKILAFGTATQADKTAQIASSPTAEEFALLQVAVAGSGPVLSYHRSGVVLHSVLGEPVKRVLKRLQSDTRLRDAAQDLGIDPGAPDLARRLMASALQKPGVTAVLFSSSNAGRLKAMRDAAELSILDARAGEQLMAAAAASD